MIILTIYSSATLIYIIRIEYDSMCKVIFAYDRKKYRLNNMDALQENYQNNYLIYYENKLSTNLIIKTIYYIVIASCNR